MCVLVGQFHRGPNGDSRVAVKQKLAFKIQSVFLGGLVTEKLLMFAKDSKGRALQFVFSV